ncbi:hypothetical protein HK101_004901 [Irineochytrium annulatum]|nr:hypothetical protein HK101_004901 [Irineochytrium annulatum]
MPFVLASQQGWLQEKKEGEKGFEFKVLNDIAGLRKGVVRGEVDAFLWERFTTKPYYDTRELLHFANITPSWPAFLFAASTTLSNSPLLPLFLSVVSTSAARFTAASNRTSMVEEVSRRFGQEHADVESWFDTVGYMEDCGVVERGVVEGCVGILGAAGLLEGHKGPVDVEGMCAPCASVV